MSGKVDLHEGGKALSLLNLFACVTAAWAFLYPRPYLLVVGILFLLPFAALTWLAPSKAQSEILKERGYPYVNVGCLVCTPCIVLLIRTALDTPISDFSKLALIAGSAACVFLLISLVLLKGLSRTPTQIAGLFVVFVMYFASLASQVDSHFRVSEVVARGKLVKKVGFGPKSPLAEVEVVMNGQPTSERMFISKSLYNDLKDGDQFCVKFYEGILGTQHAYPILCN